MSHILISAVQSGFSFPSKDCRSTRPLSTNNNWSERNIRKHIIDLYIVTSVFIAGHSRLRLRRSPGRIAVKGTRKTVTVMSRRGAIYIFGGAEGHGLSRGNGIFEARRSRKAIIPKAVLIKAQPRYIVAMPHTPICPPPSRTSLYPHPSGSIVHSSTTSLPPATPFVPGRSCVGIHSLSSFPDRYPVLFLSITLVDT